MDKQVGDLCNVNRCILAGLLATKVEEISLRQMCKQLQQCSDIPANTSNTVNAMDRENARISKMLYSIHIEAMPEHGF
jgi:hypothetical protein